MYFCGVNTSSQTQTDSEASNLEVVTSVFEKFLEEKNYRKTPERFSILKEIYSNQNHFNAEELYDIMKQNKYRVSRATIYNTLELLLDAKLIRKHQFANDNLSYYEKSFFNKLHDHIVMLDSGEVIEFCDPRIQSIKATLEEIFDISIEKHSLYFYARKKNS